MKAGIGIHIPEDIKFYDIDQRISDESILYQIKHHVLLSYYTNRGHHVFTFKNNGLLDKLLNPLIDKKCPHDVVRLFPDMDLTNPRIITRCNDFIDFLGWFHKWIPNSWVNPKILEKYLPKCFSYAGPRVKVIEGGRRI